MNNLEKLRKLEAEDELEKLKKQLPHKFTSLYDWQREFVNSTEKINLCTAANQPLLITEKIPTPEGYKLNGSLVVGDEVFGSDGLTTKIIAKTPITTVEEYKFTFDDGSTIIAGPEHKWICKGENERFRKSNGHGGINKKYGSWQVKNTQEIIESGRYSPNTLPRLRHSIPICEPVTFPKKDLIFDPYLLGCLIGDGSMRDSVTITSMDSEILDAFGDSLGKLQQKKNNRAKAACIIGAIPKMKELSLHDTLSHTKFIPEDYKMGSIQQRKDILAGLLDTDGTVDKPFQGYSYCTTSPQLKDDFIEVLNSLGGVVNGVRERYTKYDKGTKIGRKSYTINFKTTFNPFKLNRKASKWKSVGKYKHERIIYKIEKTGNKNKMMCISVDNVDKSYIASKQYIVTHNSGKSVMLIVRAILHATEPDMWAKLWPKMIQEGKEPTQFWYLYSDKSMIMREFETKWIREWLPRGEARYEGKYRWDYRKKDKSVEYIHFLETDVKIYFFSYEQGVHSLQASTVYEMFVDEELPFDSYDELSARLTIPRGYFNAAFTATRAQEEWRKAMEEKGDEELFKTAFKKQISVWDCKTKEDGTPGLYDDELITLRMAQCSTHNEVLKRMYGKFVKADGLKVPQFDLLRHFVKSKKLLNLNKWAIWAGIDPGSGGHAHPAGIVFVAVNDECTKGRVIKAWRGDKENTTNTQILQKYQEMAKGIAITGIIYDKQCRDLYLQAVALNIAMIPANKNREDGFGMLNSLFKHDMLQIFHKGERDQTHKLKNELMSYSEKHSKSKASCPDNLIDPLRYLCIHIAWNFDAVIHYNLSLPDKKEKVFLTERDEMIAAQEQGKLQEYLQSASEQVDVLQGELDEWGKYHDEFQD